MNFIEKNHGVARPVLLGHSMGASVVAAFAVEAGNQKLVRALVLSAAGLLAEMTVAMRIKKFLGRFVRKIAPRLSMSTGLNLKYLSHDPDVIDAYKRDPLVHDRISARAGIELLESGEGIISRASSVTIPVWIAHGGEDGIASPESSRSFFRNCSSEEKSLNIYPKLYHEIFNETKAERALVLADLRKWLAELS